MRKYKSYKQKQQIRLQAIRILDHERQKIFQVQLYHDHVDSLGEIVFISPFTPLNIEKGEVYLDPKINYTHPSYSSYESIKDNALGRLTEELLNNT